MYTTIHRAVIIELSTAFVTHQRIYSYLNVQVHDYIWCDRNIHAYAYTWILPYIELIYYWFIFPNEMWHQHSKYSARAYHRPKYTTNWATRGSGMQAIFLESGQRSCGTGVFLPQRAGTDIQPTRKPGNIYYTTAIIKSLKWEILMARQATEMF